MTAWYDCERYILPNSRQALEKPPVWSFQWSEGVLIAPYELNWTFYSINKRIWCFASWVLEITEGGVSDC